MLARQQHSWKEGYSTLRSRISLAGAKVLKPYEPHCKRCTLRQSHSVNVLILWCVAVYQVRRPQAEWPHLCAQRYNVCTCCDANSSISDTIVRLVRSPCKPLGKLGLCIPTVPLPCCTVCTQLVMCAVNPYCSAIRFRAFARRSNYCWMFAAM